MSRMPNQKRSTLESPATLNQIKDIELGGSFGTKIDTLARHLLWIRSNDPGARSVVFSQFKEFLEVLGRAFELFGICFTSFDKINGVQSFKSDPTVGDRHLPPCLALCR